MTAANNSIRATGNITKSMSIRSSRQMELGSVLPIRIMAGSLMLLYRPVSIFPRALLDEAVVPPARDSRIILALKINAQQNDRMLMAHISVAKTSSSPLERTISVGVLAPMRRFPTITSQHKPMRSRFRISMTRLPNGCFPPLVPAETILSAEPAIIRNITVHLSYSYVRG